MKRTLLWSLWALIPVAVLAYHFGPGQTLLARDSASTLLNKAMAAEQAEEWASAADLYAQARSALGEQNPQESARLALAEARARAYDGDLLAASQALEGLLQQQLEEKTANTEFIGEVRAELASTAYATAWAMRLEGAAEDEWMPEAEVARQQYRLLAESAVARGGANADELKENLEAVIRFEDLDDSELQAMKMPKKCDKCKGGLCQKKREQRSSKQKPGKPKDARDQIQKQAGSNEYRPKGS
ncbi:hypothetical protein BH11PLA1_BH11PLA1_14380 [soil metagenome]